MNVADLRTFDDKGWRFNLHLRYCPECSCIKSGYAVEPNGHAPSCSDSWCLCHEATR